jgi:DNA-binding LacI/PurR family transcriptional regulator
MNDEASKQGGWVTAADVARLAGVSRSAVSRTFTEGASVAPDTRAKVLKAAEALGYQVNMLARGMIQKQSNLVGVVVPGFDNPFVQRLLGPLTHHLALRSLAPLLMDASEPDQMAHTLRHLLQYRIAGVILTSGAPPTQLAREYLRLRIPVTMINRSAEVEGVDVINSDNGGGGALAAQLLLSSGATRIAFLTTASPNHSAAERGQGFKRALARELRAGAATLRVVNARAAVYQGGFDAGELLFSPAAERPDGVFCANDALACGLLDAARLRFGLRIPQDLSIVGFDDIPLAGLAAYDLSTVRQDTDALAQRAVDCLMERIERPEMPGRVIQLPVSLVQRGSARHATAPAPAARATRARAPAKA